MPRNVSFVDVQVLVHVHCMSMYQRQKPYQLFKYSSTNLNLPAFEHTPTHAVELADCSERQGGPVLRGNHNVNYVAAHALGKLNKCWPVDPAPT